MKIFVFSDSHQNCEVMKHVLNARKGEYDTVIHLGDCVSAVPEIDRIIGITPLIAVCGNCDYPTSFGQKAYPDSKAVELCGHRFYICHGHTVRVKQGLEALYYTAMQNNCTIALFGHTHIPFCEKKGNITLFNPGSIGKPFLSVPTYGIITINGENVDFQIKEASQ